jgi:hypothetical protein
MPELNVLNRRALVPGKLPVESCIIHIDHSFTSGTVSHIEALVPHDSRPRCSSHPVSNREDVNRTVSEPAIIGPDIASEHQSTEAMP